MTDGLNIPLYLIITKLMIILSLTIFGYVSGKLRLINDEGCSSLSNLVIFITMPALLFTSTLSGVSKETMLTLLFAPVFGFINVVLMLFLAIMIGSIIKMPPKKRGTFGTLCCIPNSSYLGYPLLLTILGEKGLTYAVAYDTGACLALWTVVIMVIQGGSREKIAWRQILNPALLSVLLALTINLAGIKLPEIITEPIKIMGQATVPLAMVVIGYSFIKISSKVAANLRYLLVTALVKLILYPSVAYSLLALFPLDPNFKLVVIMIAAMPSLSSAPIIAEKFGGDVDFAVSGMFFTTILGVFTIPLLLFVLG